MKKTILITGSTDGIGKLAAIKLANEGHQVLLHGRNATKLESVLEEVKKASNKEGVKGFVADLSDLEAVKQMAEQVLGEIAQLDVLINNAGVFNSKVSHTEAGFDIRYVVNYFAPYLLTHKLLPLLEKSAAPRILNLSSAAQASITADGLNGKAQLSDREAYAQSKLAITIWSFELAQKYPNIVVIPVNPGSLLNTKMVQEAFGQYWSSADKGADILYDLALSDQYKDSSGQYFDNDQGAFGEAHADAYKAEVRQGLMEQTERLVSIG